MFQNVAQETMHNENTKRNIKFMLMLKELFKPQSIVVYALTFLISMINIKGAYIPLGLAMVAAAFGSAIPAVIVYVCALLGTGIVSDMSNVVDFFWISIMFYLFLFMFKPKVCVDERNEVYKTGSRLFFAYVFISLFNHWTSDVRIVDVIYSCLYGGLLYVFYKIFVNALAVIKNWGIYYQVSIFI